MTTMTQPRDPRCDLCSPCDASEACNGDPACPGNAGRTHRILAITLTRTESFDPLSVISQATGQAEAERMVLELTDPADPAAIGYRYERYDHCDAAFIDFLIEGFDDRKLDIVLTRLQSQDRDIFVNYACTGAAPALVRITHASDGAPATEQTAREVMNNHSYAGALDSLDTLETEDPGRHKGLFRMILPA